MKWIATSSTATWCEKVPLGANDYALEWYSHNECDGDLAMEHFSIERDRRYLIPYIRAAMSIQPNLRLFASPFSEQTEVAIDVASECSFLRLGARSFNTIVLDG